MGESREAVDGNRRFSVIVTSYNYKKFVVEAVDSALAQTVAPLEVVVVDDGSTDGSREVLTERYAQHPQVKLILSENQGQLGAFMRGIQECRGEVVCFLDADDSWDPDYLDSLSDCYRRFPATDCVLANVRFTGQREGAWGSETADRDWGLTVLWAHFRTNWGSVPTSGLSLRAPLCRQVLDLPPSYLPDWRVRADDCLVYGASLLGARKRYLAAPKVNYRVHDANQWFARAQDEAASLKRNIAINRLFRHYVGDPSRVLFPPMSVLLEFKTKPEPTREELFFYLGLVWRSPQSLFIRLRQALSMLRYYWRARRQRGRT